MGDDSNKNGAPRRDPLAGTPYTAISAEVLGRGSMGVVYAAEHRRLKKAVCVKVLHAELAQHRELVDRMRVEAQALAVMDGHPNLLLVSDFGETPAGQPFIVTERLYGRNLLQERKSRGEIPVAEAIDLVCQALAGLGAAHAQGIVHRDIKPGNLFVCDARRSGDARVVKVLDFGVVRLAPFGAAARSVAPLAFPTLEGVSVGTPKYFAPEQAHAHAVDHRADLYAMGAVLYALVAGRGPFDHRQGVLELSRAAVEEAPAPASAYAKQAIPPALDRVLSRALAKLPDDRFQTAEAMAAALRRIDRSTAPPRWDQTEIVVAPARSRPAAPADLEDAAPTVELPRKAPVASATLDETTLSRVLRPIPYAATVVLPTARGAHAGDPRGAADDAATVEMTRNEAPKGGPEARGAVSRRARVRHLAIVVSMGTMIACVLLLLAFAVLRGCLV
ncbi:MAG: serine/threonine-protein kinase [Polyangiaceae bacterium]